MIITGSSRRPLNARILIFWMNKTIQKNYFHVCVFASNMQGAEGVKNVLDILRSQLDDVLAISGKKRCSLVNINTVVSCSRWECFK